MGKAKPDIMVSICSWCHWNWAYILCQGRGWNFRERTFKWHKAELATCLGFLVQNSNKTTTKKTGCGGNPPFSWYFNIFFDCSAYTVIQSRLISCSHGDRRKRANYTKGLSMGQKGISVMKWIHDFFSTEQIQIAIKVEWILTCKRVRYKKCFRH